MSAYPNNDIERAAGCGSRGRLRKDAPPRALIARVKPESPADDAGFEPGCYLTSVDGEPLRDIIDWRWLAADDVIEVGYIDLDGEEGSVELVRDLGEDWGFAFEGVVFDAVKLCRNACTFCFMRQLPERMRPSLSLRDDDFRLSFLSGTFVTLTNLTPDDEARIVEQRISPLRVSLHAVGEDVRRRLIGKHAQHGIEALDRLLGAGIEVHAQIVLLPNENDGAELRRTLEWAYARPGILNIGIVPLGYTRHQESFDRSFNDEASAQAVIEVVEPFQRCALAERGTPWVFAADEFYRNAFPLDAPAHVPPASHYGDFSLFEDGIGIIRSYIDEFAEAVGSGLAQRAADALDAAGLKVVFVVGEAMQPFLDRMLAASPLVGRLSALTVRNDYFGGNVDVTGLLCGCDIARAVRAHWEGEAQEASRQLASPQAPVRQAAPGAPAPAEPPCSGARDALYVVPRVLLNDNLVTLDDMTVGDLEKAAGVRVRVVSCNPLDYLAELIRAAEERAECGGNSPSAEA